MTNRAPKPLSKYEVNKDIGLYERKYTNKANTLSQFFSSHVLAAYDLANLSASELVALHEGISKKPRASMIVLELKKVR